MSRRLPHVVSSFVVGLVVTLLLVGCQPPAEPDGDGDDSAGSGAAADAASDSGEQPAAAEKIDVRVVDRAGYDEVIAGRKGKIVLVDFWATWCEPCKEQFPHTVELAEKYGDSGLAAVSVSFDDPSQKEYALAFLKEHGATFDNLLSEYGIGTESFEKFNIEGGVPHYKLYDRSGKLRYSFSDQLEEQEGVVEPTKKIEVRVKELMAEKTLPP